MYRIELPPKEKILGKHAFITRQQPVLKRACNEFGRNMELMCIKVFYGNPMKKGDTLRNALWGDNPLPPPSDTRKNTTVFAGSQVQNILWRQRVCPRVYAIFEADLEGNRVACQLTDFIEGEHAEYIEECYQMKKKIDEIGKDYGFASQTDKFGPRDLINGICVDPQLWAFDKRPYKEVVEEIYYEKAKYGKIYYQNDDELGFHGGPRHSEDRVKYMKLDKINFKGKVVWDVGCAGGFFCRYAIKRGAKRVIGLDLKEPLEAAFHAGNLLGYFNIDYIECDLMREIPVDQIPKADIAFFLSMNLHVGVPQQMLELVNTIIFEDNGKESRGAESLEEPWTKYYKRIEFVGRALDHGNKSLYHIFRK